MVQIDFTLNPVVSFFSLWYQGFNSICGSKTGSVSKDFSEVVEAYSSENISCLEETFPHICQENVKQLYQKLKVLMDDVDKGEYLTGSSLIQSMKKTFGLNDNQVLTLQSAYTSFEKFYNSNKHKMLQNKNALFKSYEKENVFNYIDSLYDIFQVDKSDKPKNYLHHYPKKLMNCGYMNFNGIHQNISLTKDEEGENYLPESCVLKRRTYTPIHEMGHWLFEKSALRQMLSCEGTYGDKFFKAVCDSFSTGDNQSKKSRAINCIHEGFADSCSCYFRAEDIDGKKINSNSEEADMMVHVMYPVFKKYMDDKKTLDDSFFKAVLESKEFQEKFSNKQGAVNAFQSYNVNNR